METLKIQKILKILHPWIHKSEQIRKMSRNILKSFDHSLNAVRKTLSKSELEDLIKELGFKHFYF